MTKEQIRERDERIEQELEELDKKEEMAVLEFHIQMEKLAKQYNDCEISASTFTSRTIARTTFFHKRIESYKKRTEELYKMLSTYY